MINTIEITFWGVRGSIPANNKNRQKYGTNTSCVEVNLNEYIIILDAGTGIYNFGLDYLKRDYRKDIIVCITHSHWDHIQGLPFFIPAYLPQQNITIIGCNQGMVEFKDILKNQMVAPYFPVEIENWKANIAINTINSYNNFEIKLNNFKIEAMYVEHPGMTLGYKLLFDNKIIIYIPDNELFANFPRDKIYKHNEIYNFDDMELIFIEEQKSKFFGFINNADILIHDAQYTPDEYKQRIGWGHSCFEDTVKSGLYGNVKHLILFHHDPTHSDKELDEILKKSREIVKTEKKKMKVSAAYEGLKIIL